MHKLTYLLLLLVLTTLGFSLVRHRIFTTAAIASQKDPDHHKRVNERFPTVDYNEQELVDTEKNAQRKEKQKRYNDGKTSKSAVLILPMLAPPLRNCVFSDLIFASDLR